MITVQKVSQFIHRHRLFTTDEKLLVGVSGGADSVALLHILHQLGYSCIVAHCNFHLRGEESDRDARFVQSLAKELNFPLRMVDFQTEKYASEQKISIEMAARELRYQWFAELKEAEKVDCIAIAHHTDDMVETFLINLTRGTGIHGLTGIKPSNNGIVRPLLCLSRREIKAYLEENNFAFVEDSTNKETIYIRNKFRNQIIPLMQEINPSFNESLLQTIRNLRETELFVEKRLETMKENGLKENADGTIIISIKKLKEEPSPAFVLYELLQPYGFTAAVVNDICRQSDGTSGKPFFSKKYRIVKNREQLILTKRKEGVPKVYYLNENENFISEPFEMSITLQQHDADWKIVKDKHFCYLDVDKLTFPLEIRKWKKGDSFVPFGMKNRKKVSDFFIDKHYSIWQKEQTWLLLSGGEIVWIIGERSDDRFKIESKTKKIVILERK